MAQHEPELPHGIALAWGLAANPQRGPKREMSVERIVDSAIEIADEGGIGAVSMSAVAARLGFTPMSLYRYVSAKDDLLLLMVEQAQGVPPESIREAEGWRAGLTVFAREALALFVRHPWVLDVPVLGVAYTPNSLAWADSALEALRDTPLDYAERLAAMLAINAQVRFEGMVGRGYAAAAAAAGTEAQELDAQIVAWLPQLVTPEQFPQVHPAMESGVFGPDGAGPFGFGLERLLDGIEAYIAARPHGAGARPSVDVEAEQLAAVVARDAKVREAAKAVREAERALRDARKRQREQERAARERARR